jgi:hypothetical protein
MGLYHARNGQPGICDRCGRRVEHGSLRSEVVRGKDLSNQICSECYDEDHPQNWVGSRPVADRENVVDAVPEPSIVEERSLFGFNPVLGAQARARVGAVQVLTP